MTEGLFQLIENLDTAVTISPESTVSRTVYQDEHIKAVLFGFAEGQELSEHTASMPAIMHFISGDADVTVGKDPIKAGQGTWIHMQPNVSHSVYAKTNSVMLLLLLKCGKPAPAHPAVG